jgi:crossover junction endodeoxyribonuclease RuvC
LKIIGIDPGMGKMGLCQDVDDCITNKAIVSTIGTHLNIGNKIVKVTSEEKRLSFFKDHVVNGLELLLYINRADLAVIEAPFGIMGHGRILLELVGMIKFLLIQNKIDFCEVPQSTLKKFATGSGKAEKSQMVLKASKEYGFEAATEDEVDAFWLSRVGKCLLYPEKFSESRRDTLKKIDILRPNHAY